MSIIHTYTGDGTNLQWDGLEAILYPQPELNGITKFLLVGKADQAQNFEIRLFEFVPGAKSDHVRHDKEYGFYILEGQAKFQVNGEEFRLSARDVAYISKDELLQISNTGDQSLRFICVTTVEN